MTPKPVEVTPSSLTDAARHMASNGISIRAIESPTFGAITMAVLLLALPPQEQAARTAILTNLHEVLGKKLPTADQSAI